MNDDSREWMELCERRFVRAMNSGVTGETLDDLEEEYEEARRMYRLDAAKPALTATKEEGQ